MAFDPIDAPDVAIGTKIRHSTFGEKVRTNLDDHEARILDLEAVIGSPGGTPGDVVGPGASTDNAIARYDGTTGKLLQNSGITIPDGASGSVNGTNTGDVTLAGVGAYLSLVGQVLTRALIDLTAHVTGRLPWANVAQVTAQRLLGRNTGTGDVQEIAIGSGLALDGAGLRVTAAGGGAPSLDELTDVVVGGSPATNDVLQYDGAIWTNQPIIVALDDLSDVAIAAPATGEVLKYDGATWENGTVGDVVGPSSSVDAEIALFDSTSGKLLKRATGTGYVHATSGVASVAKLKRTIGMIIGDGTNVITTGVQGFLSVPVACTIVKVRLLSADAAVTSGSVVIDIWKDTYANYPPTVADTITASAKPTITTATKSEDSTLTGWTTSLAAGDVLGFNVDSVTSLKRVVLELTVEES